MRNTAIRIVEDESIEIVRRQRPFLILMDIRLAGAMDGVATLDRSTLRARMHKLGIQKP